MPLYDYECKICGDTFEEFQTIKNMDVPVNNPCPSCKEKGKIIRLVGFGAFVDPAKLESTKGRIKPTKEFTEVMNKIRKNHPSSNFEVR